MYFSRVRLRPEILKSSQLNRVLENNTYGAHRLLWDLFSAQQRSYLFREEIAREQLNELSHARGESVYYLVSKDKPVEPENSLFVVETKNYQPQLSVGQRLYFECRVNPVITKKGKKHDVVMDAQLVFLKTLIEKFNLETELSSKPKKQDYKKLLLAKGGEPLKQYLQDLLDADIYYAERLQHRSTITDKLEWAIKAHIDNALESWWKRQGERCGFQLGFEDNGFGKFQNSAYQWHALPEKGKQAGFSSVDLVGELQITDKEKFTMALFNGIGRSKAFGCGLLIIRKK